MPLSDKWNKADALIRLATALSQAGLWQEAKQYWQEAEHVIATISYEGSKAYALAGLAIALTQAGLWQKAKQYWQEAECVIDSIPDEWSKADALAELAIALSQAGLWQEAERIIGSITNDQKKVQALHSLVTELAQHGQQSRAISTIQREWLHSVSRDDALNLFSLVFSLIPSYPDLGMRFYETFAWVDSFLQG